MKRSYLKEYVGEVIQDFRPVQAVSAKVWCKSSQRFFHPHARVIKIVPFIDVLANMKAIFSCK